MKNVGQSKWRIPEQFRTHKRFHSMKFMKGVEFMKCVPYTQAKNLAIMITYSLRNNIEDHRFHQNGNRQSMGIYSRIAQ